MSNNLMHARFFIMPCQLVYKLLVIVTFRQILEAKDEELRAELTELQVFAASNVVEVFINSQDSRFRYCQLLSLFLNSIGM